MSYIKHSDCFDEFKNIKNKSINFVCVDLPYGQTACEWDTVIDLKQMWVELKRICKDDCIYAFFCTVKFGNSLINSNPRWFRYDIVWEKSSSVGFLNANKMPLRKHEMIYIFSYNSPADLENKRNLELREYASNVKTYINKPLNKINAIAGNRAAEHFFYFNSTQFGLPTQKTYDKLIEHFNIDKMEGFIDYDTMKAMWSKMTHTYNPQKTPGKPYKVKACKLKNMNVYGKLKAPTIENKTGDRHPTSIIKFNYDKEKYHRTQKPVALCEWLIKTYTNKGDTVLDFTMGSGSTVVACKNTNRNYIGIEKDKEIFDIAKTRIIQ